MINPQRSDVIDRIFLRLHGRFGSAFMNKYRTGSVDAVTGQDEGILNAKEIWAEELAGLSMERLKAGLDAQYEHAPSCDAFKANCRVKAEIQDYKALPKHTDPEADRAHADQLKKQATDLASNKRNYRGWIEQIKNGDPKTFPNYEISLRYALEAEKA